jgi:hypothetical protein
MGEKTRILFLSANPPNTGPIRVDEEAREVFKRLEEGSNRDAFELIKHPALRPGDLQLLLMKYRPEIVHFCGHSSLAQKIFMEGPGGKGKQIATEALVEVFRLYQDHVRVVVLNACSTRDQAQALTAVIDYTVGAGKGIGDRAAIKFAGAFYRALSFAVPVEKAFDSARAELLIQKIPRSNGLELFKREGLNSTITFVSDPTVSPEDQRVALSASLCNWIDADIGCREKRMLNRGTHGESEMFTQVDSSADGLATVVETPLLGG